VNTSVKDRLLLAGGFIIAFYEMVFEQADRPYLLGLAAAMMGLTVWTRKPSDEKKTNEDTKV
jgi:hypothetical protein